MANSRHVTPKDNQWQVKKAGSSRASSLHKTQAEAIATAREQARRNNEELVIHNRKGQIREKDSYGNNPRKIKG